MADIQPIIEDAFDNRDQLSPSSADPKIVEAVEAALASTRAKHA